MTLYLPGLPVSLWYWRASLMAASVTSEPPHWNLTADRSPGASSARSVASCTASGLVPCIGGEKQRVSSWARRASRARRVVGADGEQVDAGQGVEVAFSCHVPVVHAVGAGHDERVAGPLGHLVADEDVTEEALLGRLRVGD